jgi:hypothetical protein
MPAAVPEVGFSTAQTTSAIAQADPERQKAHKKGCKR